MMGCDVRLSEVIFPVINGQELNNDPNQLTSGESSTSLIGPWKRQRHSGRLSMRSSG